MSTERVTTPDPAPRGVTTGQVLLLFGVGEIVVIYVLLALETPLQSWANRLAETWGGRVALAAAGWLIISVVMIGVLSYAERRAKRRPGGDAT